MPLASLWGFFTLPSPFRFQEEGLPRAGFDSGATVYHVFLPVLNVLKG